jgi:hypothetical protein
MKTDARGPRSIAHKAAILTAPSRSKAPVMLSKLRTLLVGTITLLSVALHAQQTIHVPADQPTIQAGINAANPGDTVLVAPGTYYENIAFNGKAITVTSSGGATATTIDGGATPGLAVVGFGNNETRSSVLSDFTIRNGGMVTFESVFTSNAGGGIYIFQSAPTILNNIITANQCDGIDVHYGAALIQGNTISATAPADNAYCAFQPVGIVLFGNFPNSTMFSSIIGNTIENNLSKYGGTEAAIFIWVSNGNIIVGNTIRNNLSSQGAVQMFNSDSVIFSQNLVYGNSISGTITAGEGAGALYLAIPDGAPPFYGVIANNTFANNTTSAGIGGASEVYVDGDVSLFSFVNNILYGSGSYPLLVCNGAYVYLSPGPMLVENNDAFNPSGPTYDSSCANGAGVAGNITADPLFESVATNDFHLQPSSPAIDAGNNQALALLMPYGISLLSDLDGNHRLQAVKSSACIIDMGVYEYPEVADACSTAEILTSSLNPSTFCQTVTFTAQLSSTKGVPTGDVQFADGTATLESDKIDGTGSSTYSTSQLAIGSHTITATYQPTGVFSAAGASLVQVVTGYASTTTLTCNPTTLDIGATSLFSALVTSTNGTPTGSITFTDGATALGQSALLNGAASYIFTGATAGTHIITATYSPTGSFAASSGTCSVTVTAPPPPPLAMVVAHLTASPQDTVAGTSIALTTTVSPQFAPNPGTPTGKVTFTFGGSTLGTVTLSAGVASLAITALPVGTDDVTCTYSGDANYAATPCNVVQIIIITIPPPPVDFTLTGPSAITFPTEATGAGTLTLTSINSFTGPVALTCNPPLPLYYVCTLSPATSSLSANGMATSTIKLQPNLNAGVVPGPKHAGRIILATLFPLALVTFGRRRRGRLGTLLCLALMTMVTMSLTACGPDVYYDATPPGTYPVTVSATGTPQGSATPITHSLTIDFILTP